MAPTIRGGDTVLVNTWKKPTPGAVVLVRWPGQVSVKRAVRPEEGGWWVLGDFLEASTDSRQLGPAEVLGVITWRLWPRIRKLR